ncbi:hypothetical protein Tco_0633543 [Tanacetum coccineum]
MSASMKARIAEHVAAPIPPTSPAYDQAPLGHRSAMIHMRDDIPEEDIPPQRRFVLTAPPLRCDVAESSAAAARPHRGQYDFVDTVKLGQGLIRSSSHDAQTIARAANKAEDVGYVRASQASEHRMMTSIEEVNLRVSYQAQVTILLVEHCKEDMAYLRLDFIRNHICLRSNTAHPADYIRRFNVSRSQEEVAPKLSSCVIIVTNLAPTIVVDPVPTRRVHTVHPISQIIGDITSPVLKRGTLKKSKFGESAYNTPYFRTMYDVNKVTIYF